MKSIILTGGSGTLGKYLMDELVKKDFKIILPLRSKSIQKTITRIKCLAKGNAGIMNKFEILEADLLQFNFGLSNKKLISLTKNTEYILHAAASTRLNSSLDQARENNVKTSRNIIKFAKNCTKLKRFGFISTAFVAGKRTGVILESELKRTAFINSYEQSKFEAELSVRENLKTFPVNIFRPSIILTPKTDSNIINALTLGLFLARKGFLPILPGNGNYLLDLVKGGYVAEVIIKILLNDYSDLTYHISSFKNSLSIKELIKLLDIKKNLNIRFCGDEKSFNLELKKMTKLRPDLKLVYKKVESFLPELAYPKLFDNTNLLKNQESLTKRKIIEAIKILL